MTFIARTLATASVLALTMAAPALAASLWTGPNT